MWAVSDEFKRELQRGHSRRISVDIYENGELVTDAPPLYVTGGSIDKDGQRAVRTTGRMTLVDKDGLLTPQVATDLLSPFGNEIKPQRGVRLPSTGQNELVPLGMLPFAVVDVEDKLEGVTIQLELYDRARRIEGNRFLTPYIVAAGLNYGDAIKTLLLSRYAGLTFDFAPTSRTTPELVFPEQGDPWKAALEMAASIGMELFFRGDGVCVMRPVPVADPSQVVATYAPGNYKILGLTKRYSSEQVYNYVIATGEGVNNATPFRGEAWDGDAASPTWIGGGLGIRPYWMPSPMFTSNEQCVEAALAQLRRKIGASEDVKMTGVVNPAHEPGDVIQMTRVRPMKRRDVTMVDSLAIMDAFTIPLGVGEHMPTTTRRTRDITGAA